MKFDYQNFAALLDEADIELLRILATQCKGPSDYSQLSAVLFLLIRASSLLRSALVILEAGRLDAYDAVKRAYWESWALAFEFRLEGSQPRTARWHSDKNKNGIPDVKRIEDYMKSQGISSPLLRNDYGGLSEAAHPTKLAAENSVVVVVAPRSGDILAGQSLAGAREAFEGEQSMTMYRFLWLVLEEREGLIAISSDLGAMPNAHKFTSEFLAAYPDAK
jgi:hypothetical protein